MPTIRARLAAPLTLALVAGSFLLGGTAAHAVPAQIDQLIDVNIPGAATSTRATVVVTDSDDDPVQTFTDVSDGAELTLHDVTEGATFNVDASITTSDSDGWYDFSNSLSSDGDNAWSVDFVQNLHVRGSVSLQSVPLPGGFTVALINEDGVGDPQQFPGSTFSYSEVEPGYYDLKVASVEPGWAPYVQSDIHVSGGDVNIDPIVLKKYRAISGTVTTGGAPVDGGYVNFFADWLPGATHSLQAEVDAHGHYSTAGLVDGTYSANGLSADGASYVERSVTVDGDASDVDFALEALGPQSGNGPSDGSTPAAAVPAPAASAPTADVAQPVVTAPTSAAPGSSVKVGVAAGTLPANTSVDLYVYSTPVKLGSATTAADGSLTTTVKLPATLASGVHHIAVYDPTTGKTYFTNAITVGTPLAYTGAPDQTMPLLIALLVVLVGSVALVIARMRRRRS